MHADAHYAQGIEEEIMFWFPFIQPGGLHGDANSVSGSLEYACSARAARAAQRPWGRRGATAQ